MHEQSLPGSPSCAHSASTILAKSDWPHPASATPAPPANSSDKRMRCGFIVEYLPKNGPRRLNRGKLSHGQPQSLDRLLKDFKSRISPGGCRTSRVTNRRTRNRLVKERSTPVQ